MIHSVFRYPVKGLSPEPLERVVVTPGETLPMDRAFALALGDTTFDPRQPEYLHKTKFAMLARNEKLAALRTRYDDASGTLHVAHGGRKVLAVDLKTPEGAARLEDYLTDYLGKQARGRLKLVHAPGHSFSDVAMKCISIINLASVRALEAEIGTAIDPLRFRANFYIEKLDPWREFDWLGQTIRLGSAQAVVEKRIERCAATNVNPATAQRDLNILRSLHKAFGHTELGVYARITMGGEIAPGDRILPQKA